jgi:N-carbamoylputrescine amidase
MKILVAAAQMQAELFQLTANLQRADALLREARRAGAELAVLPEMFNTGYGLLPDFGPSAEEADGPTLRHLSHRSRQWRMGIAAGFVERHQRHLYDALALCLPDGSIRIYRKRHLVFWERFRFRPGRSPLIVPTPWGRIGLAICADMIYSHVWDEYRGRIDLGVIASAWPEFACRHSGRKHWLFGHLGPLSAEIPVKVARDLDIPVICVNQCGSTRTTIPMLGTRLTQRIDDRFAGRSSICDGRETAPIIAGVSPQLVLSEVTVRQPRGPRSCRSMSPSVSAASSSRPERSGPGGWVR